MNFNKPMEEQGGRTEESLVEGAPVQDEGETVSGSEPAKKKTYSDYSQEEKEAAIVKWTKRAIHSLGAFAGTQKDQQPETLEGKQAILAAALAIREKGLDRVVVHGKKTEKMPDGSLYAIPGVDFDTRASLFILNTLSKKAGENPIVEYNEGAYTEIVPKGSASQEEPRREDEVVMYVDTGETNFKVEKIGEQTVIYNDHHQPEKASNTSSTEHMAKILIESGIVEEKPEWLDGLIQFTNEVDNLSYVDIKKGGKRTFNEQVFKEQWSKSLYGLYDKLPFETALELIKAGKINEPFAETNDEEVKKIIKQQQEQVQKTLFGAKIAAAESEKLRFKKDSGLGTVLYHNFASFIGSNNKKIINTIPNHLGFLATKALGYDTFVVFNPKNKSFFINSSEKNLNLVLKRLQAKAPGTKPIRGTMIFPPTAIPADFSEAQFLRALGLK